MSVLSVLASDVPVTPDAEQARTWLERELLLPAYQHRPSLLDQLTTWLEQLFLDAPWHGLNGTLVAGLAVVALALVTAVAFWVAGPVRRTRRTRSSGLVHVTDDRRTAAQIRIDADAAATRGDWDRAVAERFRALVRSLEERAVIDERPGRTAHEAVEAALRRLPALTAGLRRAGVLFDDVVYGGVPATSGDDTWLRGLDAEVMSSRPGTVAGATTVGADA